MIDFIQENLPGVVCGVVFIVVWLIQIFYLFFYFLKAGQSSKEKTEAGKPVSVVVCARNEEKNLMEHVPVIMEQDYPEFELVVVNDSSWDDTREILKALQLQYPNMHVVNLDEEKQNMQGKKFALTLGIKAAKHDTILLTDADCVPVSSQWIREMTGRIQGKKQLALGFSPYRSYPGWLNKIIRFDTLVIAMQYLGFAKAGKPYMGVGRNLAYDKELFFRVGGFKSHYSVASGDDDLFVNQVATSYNTVTVASPASQTISEPKKTWKDWFIQKRRHFTTTPFYRPSHKFMLALWPLTFLVMMAAYAGVLVFQTGVLLVSGLVLLRYIILIATLHKVSTRLGQRKDLVWLSLPLEIHLHVLNLGLYFMNLMRKPQKWN